VLLNNFPRLLLGLLAFFGGAYVTVCVPAAYYVAERRAYDESIGHLPNMDPGVIWVMQVFIAVPLCLMALGTEAFRLLATRSRPVYPAGALLLGVASTAPATASLFLSAAGFGWPLLLLLAALSITGFYAVRALILLGLSRRNAT
jgi:hypothetical protein